MPDIPISRQRALVVLLCGVLALVLIGRLVARDGADAAVPPSAGALKARAPAETPVVVHVVGAVRRPGLYRLREGDRTADAVARAGGATARADLALVNLAAPVVDGAQIVVPARVQSAAGAPTAPAAARGPLHLNTATVEQLDELPGVGPATAQKIVDYRQEHGAFTSVDELDAVPGIGPARLAELRELVAP